MFEKLTFAVLYGADAVYVGGLRYGMRSASQNFSDEQLDTAIKYTHERGKQLYVTVNTLVYDKEMAELSNVEWNALIRLCGKSCKKPTVSTNKNSTSSIVNARAVGSSVANNSFFQ